MAEGLLSAFPLSYDLIARTQFTETILPEAMGSISFSIPDGYSNFSLTIPQTQVHLVVTDDDNSPRYWDVKWIVNEGTNQYTSPATNVYYTVCNKYFTVPEYTCKGPITSNKISIQISTWYSSAWRITHTFETIVINGYYQY